MPTLNKCSIKSSSRLSGWSNIFTILWYVYLRLGSLRADFAMRIHVTIIYLEVFLGKTSGELYSDGSFQLGLLLLYKSNKLISLQNYCEYHVLCLVLYYVKENKNSIIQPMKLVFFYAIFFFATYRHKKWQSYFIEFKINPIEKQSDFSKIFFFMIYHTRIAGINHSSFLIDCMYQNYTWKWFLDYYIGLYEVFLIIMVNRANDVAFKKKCLMMAIQSPFH